MAARVSLALALVAAAVGAARADHSIEKYGAVATVSTVAQAFVNAKAMEAAAAAANTDPSDRVVLVPAGSNYFMMPHYHANLSNVVFALEGNLTMHGNISAYPLNPSDSWQDAQRAEDGIMGAALSPDGGVGHKGVNVKDFWTIETSSGVTIKSDGGKGVVDGQGFEWWSLCLQNKLKHGRPHMLVMNVVKDVEVYGVTLLNSPQFHMRLHDLAGLYVHDAVIYVDVFQQKALLRRHGHLSPQGWPTFPLNTDGIDPSGTDVLIERVNITNFDDAVAVKPAHGGGVLSDCAQNYMVRDTHITFGVGLSIGSVPPNPQVNCVRNITFTNSTFMYPLKAVYVKSNPGDIGSATITDVTYSNLRVHSALWMPIWIGPQQQHQPDGSGTTCSFLYPFGGACPTNPRVTMHNLVLDNIKLTGGVLTPGVIIGNASNPHTITMNNVVNEGAFILSKHYKCTNTQLSGSGNSPQPDCKVVA